MNNLNCGLYDARWLVISSPDFDQDVLRAATATYVRLKADKYRFSSTAEMFYDKCLYHSGDSWEGIHPRIWLPRMDFEAPLRDDIGGLRMQGHMIRIGGNVLNRNPYLSPFGGQQPRLCRLLISQLRRMLVGAWGHPMPMTRDICHIESGTIALTVMMGRKVKYIQYYEYEN